MNISRNIISNRDTYDMPKTTSKKKQKQKQKQNEINIKFIFLSSKTQKTIRTSVDTERK